MKWTTRLALGVLPMRVWVDISRELKMTRRRWLSRARFRRHELGRLRGLRLHLGCGKRRFPGWLNIDGEVGPNADLNWDLRYRLPFADDSAELVYCEHFLEHLDREEAERHMEEVRRVLQPGGIWRLGVPDAEIYLRAYAEEKTDLFEYTRHLGGAVQPLTTPLEVINQMFRMGGSHLYAWDFTTLSKALSRKGFTCVQRFSSGRASRPDLCLDDPTHAFETLYVEVMKPPAPMGCNG